MLVDYFVDSSKIFLLEMEPNCVHYLTNQRIQNSELNLLSELIINMCVKCLRFYSPVNLSACGPIIKNILKKGIKKNEGFIYKLINER